MGNADRPYSQWDWLTLATWHAPYHTRETFDNKEVGSPASWNSSQWQLCLFTERELWQT